MTVEHVIPQWISRRVPDDAQITHVRDNTRWTSSVFSTTVSQVCTRCNNGWMSTLEQQIQHFVLGEVFNPGWAWLTSTTQTRLAAWALKTAMMFDYAAGTGNHFIPEQHYRYLAANQHPPQDVRVSLARADIALDGMIGRVSGYTGRPQSFAIEDASPIAGYSAAFHVGFFAATISSAVGNDEFWRMTPTDESLERYARIWHPARVLRWPLPARVSIDELDEPPFV
jgi:hypothetical protein